MRGLFIAIEGPDGVGKSEQAHRLCVALAGAGHFAERTAEPTTGEIGQLIRQALRGEIRLAPRALRLLFASDREQHGVGIEKAIALGTHVVCDRYDLSNVAYQAAEDMTLVDWALRLSAHCLVPDMTIVLYASVETCRARLRARGGMAEIYEGAAFQRDVHDAYRHAASLLGRPVERISASGTHDEVAALVWAAVERRLAERSGA